MTETRRPTDLFLVRHGESVPNVEPVIGGMLGDAGLTPRGREQAALLQERLATEGFRADHLYASTLPRALETAGYVAKALGLPVLEDDELHELRPGDADGMSVEEWRARYGDFDEALSDPGAYKVFATGGESWAAFLARAGAALVRLVERHPGERVVAVCHGGVLNASFALAFGLGPTSHRVRLAPHNTGITHWRYHPGLPSGETWTLASFNDAAHLDLTDTADAAGRAVPLPASSPPDEA